MRFTRAVISRVLCRASTENLSICHYLRGAAEIELIVPDFVRRYASGATVKSLGASAQRVKDLKLLLAEPTELEAPNVGRVRVPNPAAYIIQKVLTPTGARCKKGQVCALRSDALRLSTLNGYHSEVVALASRVISKLTKKPKARLLETAAKLGALTSWSSKPARPKGGPVFTPPRPSRCQPASRNCSGKSISSPGETATGRACLDSLQDESHEAGVSSCADASAGRPRYDEVWQSQQHPQNSLEPAAHDSLVCGTLSRAPLR